MSKPLVAIVGRPNVGKSTLINGLAQRRVSIVEDIPGVTRDRIYCDVKWLNREFTLIDTGGIEFRNEKDQISSGIRQQAELAMEEADVILFVLDARAGLTSDDEIIDMYRGLWRIEESFKVTKSELEARPVYVWTKEHIEAHFLTCFVALTIARILDNKLEHKYSVGTILGSLAKAECSLVQQNYYSFDYYDEVLKDIGLIMDIDFGKRIRTLGEIKKILAKTKK